MVSGNSAARKKRLFRACPIKSAGKSKSKAVSEYWLLNSCTFVPALQPKDPGLEVMPIGSAYFFGLKLKLCPPTEASYIKPPLVCTNTAMPLW